jgi:trypsin
MLASKVCKKAKVSSSFSKQGKDSCEGDSGGPLLALYSDVVIGVVTSGYKCAHPEYPGLYGSVAAVVEWINEVLTENQAL